MMKVLVSAVALSFVASGVVAQDVVRVLSPSEQGQISQVKPELIQLAPGYGITLSWLGTRENIKKVWLDNPAFVVLDADGCLEGLNNNCHGSAKVLHLRRIEKLNLGKLPPTNHSLLTVVTENNGSTGLYLFKIVPASTPQYLVYEIQGSSRTTQSPISYTTIAQGMEAAREQGLLVKGSLLEAKLQALVKELESGRDLATLTDKYGISEQVISRLLELGGNYAEIIAK
jgi:hypothetical protein